MSDERPPIDLRAYATVLCALEAGLSRRRALEIAAISQADWEPGSTHWQAEIEASAASDLTALVAFDAELLAAKRRFDPEIQPISSDAKAWAQFRKHVLSAVDAVAFLTEHELSLGAFARLEGDWAIKLASDPTQAKVFQDATEGLLETCPALTFVLSPLLREAAFAAPAPFQAAPVVPVSLPTPAAPAVPSFVAPPSFAASAPAPPSVGPESSSTPDTLDMPAPIRAPSGLGSTGNVDPLAALGGAVPFKPSSEPAAPVSLPRAAPVVSKRSGQTMMADASALLGGPTPFQSSAPPKPAVGPATIGDRTSLVDPISAIAPAMPFAGQQTAENPEILPLEQYGALLEDLSVEADKAAVWARYGVKPEQHNAAQAYWMQRMMREPAVATAIAQARAKRKGEVVRKPPPTQTRSPLQGTGTALSAVHPFEQHAMIIAERSLGADLPSVLQRYGLTDMAYATLDAQLREAIARDPATKAAWERACQAHRARLQAPRV